MNNPKSIKDGKLSYVMLRTIVYKSSGLLSTTWCWLGSLQKEHTVRITFYLIIWRTELVVLAVICQNAFEIPG